MCARTLASVMPARLAQTLGLSDTVGRSRLSIRCTYSIGLVVPQRDP